MYIAVSTIQVNPNPANLYLTFLVVSSGGTNITAEAYVATDATIGDTHDAIAESARQICRQNGEEVPTDAQVTIFGSATQVV